jgi:hypothetical protein
MNREPGSAPPKQGLTTIFLETLEQVQGLRIVSTEMVPTRRVPIKAMRRNARMALIFTRQKLREAIAIDL